MFAAEAPVAQGAVPGSQRPLKTLRHDGIKFGGDREKQLRDWLLCIGATVMPAEK